jgi:hypothetical protein
VTHSACACCLFRPNTRVLRRTPRLALDCEDNQVGASQVQQSLVQDRDDTFNVDIIARAVEAATEENAKAEEVSLEQAVEHQEQLLCKDSSSSSSSSGVSDTFPIPTDRANVYTAMDQFPETSRDAAYRRHVESVMFDY